jgi:hypothetical protein
LNEVFEKKKHHSGSEPFNVAAFLITKTIKVWLRDKIWYYCYYVRNGQEWIDSLYAGTKKKKLTDIEGMRTAQNRARDIMEGVSFKLDFCPSTYLSNSFVYYYV